MGTRLNYQRDIDVKIDELFKDWVNVKQCAKLVYTEFFTQGDLEKAMGNKPVESMDREKAFIPSLQIQFIDHIVLPVYKLLKVADISKRHYANQHYANKPVPCDFFCWGLNLMSTYSTYCAVNARLECIVS